jgi:hypothetical protein
MDELRLRDAVENLCRFAARFSAGDSDVDRADLQVAIDDVRAALAARSEPGAEGPTCPFDCDACNDPGPCSCGGRRWVDDENWQPDHPSVPRVRGDGLIPCGFCNFAGWDTPENAPDEFTPPPLRSGLAATPSADSPRSEAGLRRMCPDCGYEWVAAEDEELQKLAHEVAKDWNGIDERLRAAAQEVCDVNMTEGFGVQDRAIRKLRAALSQASDDREAGS